MAALTMWVRPLTSFVSCNPDMASKIYPDFASALDGLLFDGMTIMCGGFQQAGIPENLLRVLLDSSVADLTLIMGEPSATMDLRALATTGRLRKLVTACAATGERLAGLVGGSQQLVEVNSPRIFEERVRAGGAGIPAFYAFDPPPDLKAAGASESTIGETTDMRHAWLKADLALVKAWRSDHKGNLAFQSQERNFNPMMATAGKVTVVEADILLNDGTMDGDHFQTPGIFVHRIAAHSREIDLGARPRETSRS